MNIKIGQRSILSVLCVSCMASVYGGEVVNETRPVPSDSTVEIRNTRGEIRISGWDKDEVSVAGELDDLATGLTFEVDGTLTIIKVEMPTRDVSYGDGSKLEIRMPVNGRVDFDGVSTDVTLTNIQGGVSVHSVSGDITGAQIAQRLIVNSVSGDISFEDAGGKAKFTTVSGDMELDLRSESVSLNAVSGDIRLRLQSFDTLLVSTVSGELDVSGTLSATGNISVNSVSGDVSLDLNAPVNARIDVNTGPGGDITNKLTKDEPRDVFPAQMVLKTKSGDGSASISVRTVTGDVELSDRN
jgi:DUF4097 and DUF4098 domain-containing protein YvlB